MGLKNSDDVGTQFDVRVDVYRDAVLMATGLMRCITGLGRNPLPASEVTVPFGPVSNETFTAGDVLSLRVLTRIGSNRTQPVHRPRREPFERNRRAPVL